MKKVYLKGLNVIVEDYQGKIKRIPVRVSRYEDSDGGVFVISDDHTGKSFQIPATEIADENGVLIGNFQEVDDYLSSFIGSFNYAGMGGGNPANTIYDITATNYNELILNNPSGSFIGQLAYVQNSQGNSFFPWSIGGTFYPDGLYLWNGSIWSSDDKEVMGVVYQNIQDLTQLNLDLTQEVLDRANGDQLLQNQITSNDLDIQNILDSVLLSSTQWSTLIANTQVQDGFEVNFFDAFTNADKVISGTTVYDEYTILNGVIVIPYFGRPYENQRILHLIRLNFNIDTGSRQNCRVELRRALDDSVIGSPFVVERNPDESGKQEILMTYTSSAGDSFVTDGFYIAFVNQSGAGNITISGDIGVLILNVFEKPNKF